MTGSSSGQFFSPRFVKLLLLISVATNVVLLTRLKYPDAWARAVLSLHRVPPATEHDRALGPEHAAVTIIEYADFQCPFCATMHSSMQRAALEGKVRWIYRHYPLLGIHQRALAAAEAAECAGDQGKFWQFAETLYRRQAELDSLPFDSVAMAAGIKADALKACMAKGTYQDVVAQHMRQGERLRITGTPTYFINGKRFEGFRSADDLTAAIAAAED